MSPRSNIKPVLSQRSTSKKHVTSISSNFEPAIWSRDTGQRTPCFDRCQLTLTWMSNIKEGGNKSGLHVCHNLLAGSHLVRLRRRHRRRAYVPTINTASHDNHEKISSWVTFSFLYRYGALLEGPSGRRRSATNNYYKYKRYDKKPALQGSRV